MLSGACRQTSVQCCYSREPPSIYNPSPVVARQPPPLAACTSQQYYDECLTLTHIHFELLYNLVNVEVLEAPRGPSPECSQGMVGLHFCVTSF